MGVNEISFAFSEGFYCARLSSTWYNVSCPKKIQQKRVLSDQQVYDVVFMVKQLGARGLFFTFL